MAKEYSVRMLTEARKNAVERPDTRPVFMPIGRIKPETFNDALNRILATSASQGMSLQEAYESIQGDFDDDDNFDDFDDFDDDEFEQSEFAEYDASSAELPPAEVPEKEPAKQEEAPKSETETARDSEQA